MRKILLLIITLFFNSAISQTLDELENRLEAELKLGILDSVNSIKTTYVLYDEIPKYLNFRGTVVESLNWKDALGDNLLVLTLSGGFDWKDYMENDRSEFDIQDKSELYGYLFQKKTGESKYKIKWRIYDYTKCYGVDMYTGFIKNATTITDIDNDGISEISIPYVLICRGGMDPGDMKIIMYEDDTKYALRGSTAICLTQFQGGGEYTPSEPVKKNKTFSNFLKNRWELHKCENLN